MKKKVYKALNRYGPFVAITIIIILGIYVRTLDYRWPYLRNIDSYNFFRAITDIVENGGVLPSHDDLTWAPTGAARTILGDPYVYIGAYSYNIINFFLPQMQLWEFLIWFPAVLAALMAIPMYFIGKILYDRKAGILAAAFFVFDTAIISRTLGGDPDSDGIVLILPLIIIVLFLYTYKTAEEGLKKKTIIFSLLTGISLGVWIFTWSGYWFVVWLITGFVMLKFFFAFLEAKKIKSAWSKNRLPIFSYVIIMLIFFSMVLPFRGIGAIQSTIIGPISFSSIKSEEGQFPNVYVSVAEFQAPGDIRSIVQRTSPISFFGKPLFIFFFFFFFFFFF